MDPVIENGVRVATSREHEYCFEHTHQDGAIEFVSLGCRHDASLCHELRENSQVSQVQNSNDVEFDAKLHLQVPYDRDRQSSQADIGEDVAGCRFPALVSGQ